MTLTEFKAWLDGYLDGKDGLTAEQVAIVRDKIGMVVGEPLDLTPFRTYGPTYWPATPYLPGNLPGSFPAVTCGGTSADAAPAWLKGARMTNMQPLDALASEAIFTNVEALYEN